MMALKKVCYAQQMRDIDAAASFDGAIPGIVLMENAAISCVRNIEGDISGKKVLIFCGKGNNGGDGLAIARHLIQKGADVSVVCVSGTDFGGDALINYNILMRMNVKLYDFSEISEEKIAGADIVIDAIYGTGIRGEISGTAYDVIDKINKNSRFTMSVDIPSGINADDGSVCRIAVRADITVTFAAYKMGLLLYPGAEYAGKIVLEDISIPQNIIDLQDIDVNVIDESLLKSLLPKRNKNSHKGDYGKILIVGGSRGMTGAVCMAAQAALYSGGGLITAAIPSELNPVLENKLTEVMTYPLADKNGRLSSLCIDELIEKANSSTAVLFGVGMGRSDEIVYILGKFLEKCKVPVIIDADGLYALAQNKDMINSASCEIILTPHSGEFARLVGKTVDEVEKERISLSKEFSQKYGVTLVLKGSRTIVSTQSGEQFINLSGNAGMATGGSGDVLGGMMVSFVSRGMDIVNSAVLAVGMHGISGDENMKNTDIESVTAVGIIENIPSAFRLLRK